MEGRIVSKEWQQILAMGKKEYKGYQGEFGKSGKRAKIVKTRLKVNWDVRI